MAAVGAVLCGAQVSITSLGRSLSSAAFVKHKIKRMDRLIGNTRLYQERWSLYTALTRWLVQGLSHPIILIDWSPLRADQEHHVLRASLPVRGRALTLYEEVYPRSKLGNRRVQQDFLATLKTMLPLASHPIIVADSGFRVPFYRYVEHTLGWHWVGRIRNRDFISWQNPAGAWFSATSLYAKATTKPADLGTVQWVRRQPLQAFLVLVRQPKKGRQRCNQSGRQSQSHHSKKQARREKEPWLLVASLSLQAFTARQIMKLYQARMQIEEGFRDSKNYRYGLGVAHANRIGQQRRTNLLLIAALAAFLLWCIGVAGKNQPASAHFAKSAKSRNPSSLFHLHSGTCTFIGREQMRAFTVSHGPHHFLESIGPE
ncbi:IS4 family transposase [Nitrosospira multiformis]|nr:IS4 family transposase [Nitrosospira multiformis]